MIKLLQFGKGAWNLELLCISLFSGMKASDAVCQSFHVVTVHSETAAFAVKLTAVTIISLLMEEGILSWECGFVETSTFNRSHIFWCCRSETKFRICDFELN